jgi:hypothetical protein
VLILPVFVPIFLTPDVRKNITSDNKTFGGIRHEEAFKFCFFIDRGRYFTWRMHSRANGNNSIRTAA